MEVQIRDACLADAAAIYALNCDDLGYEFPEEEAVLRLRQVLASPCDRVFVATLGEEVVGYAQATDYLTLYLPPMKTIHGLAVSGRHRKLGIGKALLAAVEAWAREDGACGLRLVSGETRKGAHEFYRSCGFDTEKHQINFKKWFSAEVIPHEKPHY